MGKSQFDFAESKYSLQMTIDYANAPTSMLNEEGRHRKKLNVKGIHYRFPKRDIVQLF